MAVPSPPAKPAATPPPRGRPRRAPQPEERQRDAERSRGRLLAAALDEFSAHGYAGARINAIAKRAGLNQQLITYYFGGKAGLYRALDQLWLEKEATIAGPEVPLEEVSAGYMSHTFADPRGGRLLLWTGLTDATVPDTSVPDPSVPAEQAANEGVTEPSIRRRVREIQPDLDPDLLELALMGAVLAPVAIPQVVRRLTGLEATDPAFQARYTEQLRRITRHLLRGSGPADHERGGGADAGGAGDGGDAGDAADPAGVKPPGRR